MQTELSRFARRRRRRRRRLDLPGPEAWGPLLLAGGSLVVGGFFQNTVQFGWLAAAVGGMLLVRLGLPFGSVEPEVERPLERLPLAPLRAWLFGALGLGLLAGVRWLLPAEGLLAAWALAGVALILLGSGEVHYPLRFAGATGLLLAAGRMIALDSFAMTDAELPSLTLLGMVVEGNSLRQSSFALVSLAALAAVWVYRPRAGEGRVRGWMAVGAHLVALWAITYEVAAAIPITRGAASMGNEALWIATAWGLYGLMLVLTSPLVSVQLPWLPLGQSVFTFALTFLLMGGLMAQARWADPLPRFAAYGAAPGATLLAAWVQGRRGRLTEPDRLLAIGSAALFFGIVSFEVARWLEPLFTYPDGTMVTPAMLTRDRNLQTLWTLGLWGAYALLLWTAGGWLRSRSVRFLALMLLVSSLLYGALWIPFGA